MAAFSSVDLSRYVRIGRYDLPEPTRTSLPSGTPSWNLLAQEASAVTYNKDSDTLFVLGDGGTAIVEVSKTGQLISTMTLAKGSSPQGTDFYDPEGLAYVGNGVFVFTEERDRQLVRFTYQAGGTLQRSATQTVKLGTTVGNIGLEGVSFDPSASNSYILVKEISPQGVFQTSINFDLVSLGSISNGGSTVASNGSSTTVNSTNLFDPAKAGLGDFADVYALSNVAALNSTIYSGDLLILSQESGKVVDISRDGTIRSSLTLQLSPGDKLSIADQTHEGITMDADGNIYIVSENGGGDVNHPQMWVYAASAATNQAPTDVQFINPVTSIFENIPITAPYKLADLAVVDDGLGTNAISVSGADAAFFQADASGLYLKTGTVLDYETKNRYDVTVNVDDSTVGGTPDATRAFSLSLTDVVNENAPLPSLAITEISPWSSGNSLYKADWFEVTNTGSTAVDLSGIRIDDDSNAFGNSAPLQGVASLAPGRSAVFIEAVDNEVATINQLTAQFKSSWFGNNVPAGFQIGTYSGSGLGLSTGGDAVNLFDQFGRLITGIKVPASTTYFTFYNGSAAGSSTFPTPTVSAVSALGVNAFSSAAAATGSTYEAGSPGFATIPSIYNFSATSYGATEGTTSGGLSNAVVRINRGGDVSQASSVVLSLGDGSAKGAAAAPGEGTSTGPSTATTPYVLPISGSGVATKSLLTVGDSVGGYKMSGIPDGLGAYDNGDGTFTLLMNHELGNTLGVTRAHGGKGAFVSNWVIRKSDLSVVSGEDLIKNVYGWDATSQQSNATPNNAANANGISFYRFCSADFAEPTAFYNAATGKGSQARIFLNGEEGGSTGYALANVASGSSKGNSYVLGKFNLSTNGSGSTGVGGWENLLANPLAQDKTVVIGNNDGGTGLMNGTVVVYQGTKTTSGSEADKAGLTNGSIKFIAVNGFADASGTTVDELTNTTTRTTGISSGTRFSLSATSSTTFSRPEDGAWNPSNPNEYYFVTTDQLDKTDLPGGTQVGQTRLWRLTFDDITNPDLGGKIDLLIDGATVNGKKVTMFDNISIDKTGRITLLEDPGNADHNAKIWQYDISSGSLKMLAQHDPARFGDVGVPATAPFTVDEETSGVIDMQSILGPGWSLLVDQAHYSTGVAADLVEGGQLLALFNKDSYNAYQADYINTSQTVSFAAGETFKDVNVPVYGDTRQEAAETAALSLASPTGGVVGTDKPSATLTIQNLDPTPTDLLLSKTTVDENVAAGTVIGSFSSTAPISGDSFTYALVAGTGSTDNAAFVIVDNQLKLAASPNFEGNPSYSIRVRTTQQGGQSFEKVFTISVNDLPELASISGAATASVSEGKGVNAAGQLVATGSLTVSDPDAGQAKFSTTVSSANGNLGSLVISEAGQFTYSLSNALPAVQLLGAGQSKTDTFTVKSVDGSASKDIVITINGANAGFNAVASGDPTSNRATLWTRSFDTSDSTGRTGISESVTVQVATDSSFNTTVFTASGVTSAAANDYTLKLDATGLNPDTIYYYRFKTLAGELSSTGTFQTTPAASSRVAVHIAHSGDADGLMRPYPLMTDVASQNLDAFIFNGDTIYETSSTGSTATPATKDAETGVVSQQALLDAYHRKYLENLLPVPGGTYSGLKEFYASQANITTWDNHELGNKAFINGGAPYSLRTGSTNGSTNTADDVNTTGQFINDTTTFDTLLQAFLDYQPIRTPEVISAPADPRSDGELKLYNTQSFGLSAQVFNLDTRTFRDVRLNTATGDDTGVRADNPNRTLLGATQKAWFKQSLLDAQLAGVSWKFVNISDPIDMIGAYGTGDDGGKSWWGGYRAERNELLKFIADNGIRNVVFLSSDDHIGRINELTYMPDPTLDPSNPANFKVLDGVLSIVDGPMGATGPNLVTDHTYSNVKSLADALASKQVGAGLNPIGLDKNFPGLFNVYREGDSTAASSPKPVDFYSPDTNNYVTLDVGLDGVLSVTMRGINSYATNSFPEPSSANAPRTILSFSIDSNPVIAGLATDDTNEPGFSTVPGFSGQAQTLVTGSGKDVIDSALVSGRDNLIFTGADADTVYAGERDVITGGTAGDTLWAIDGDGSRLDGGKDNDSFYIGTKRNRALGGDGDDRFYIQDGAGTNYLNGGPGRDQFWLISANGDRPAARQMVMDFRPTDDLIGLKGVSYASLGFVQQGKDALLTVGGKEVGLFTNTISSTLANPNLYVGLL